ncbi:hypothetical protein AB0M20_14500 [Actinoplanes sp. NPDC051633]|uniref:hypothetical protein n=1 Tax=Actinoplanes sp. NPDC051633 TaxID=3155670 RepID=UPI003432C190
MKRFWSVAFVAAVFSTVLNGVPAVAQAASRCTPGSVQGMQSLLASLPTYGDGNISARLDNGRCVIVTGDALARGGGPGPHSTITVLAAGTGHVVAPAHPGTVSRYQALPDRTDGTVDWLGPAFFAEGKLYSLASRIRPRPGGWDNVGVNTAVFTVGAGKDPVFSRFMATPTAIGGPVLWGAGIYYDATARLVYIFGASSAPTDGWTGFDAYVARVGLADLGTPSRWTYFDGVRWTATSAGAKPILRSAVNGGTESAFSVWRDSQGWRITSKRGGGWGPGSVTRWTAAQFGQPWSERTVATVAGDHYLHFEHWALPLTVNGKRLLSYNTTGQPATWAEAN